MDEPGADEWYHQPVARMMALPPEARAEMGRRGREKMEREFDERIVIRR